MPTPAPHEDPSDLKLHQDLDAARARVSTLADRAATIAHIFNRITADRARDSLGIAIESPALFGLSSASQFRVMDLSSFSPFRQTACEIDIGGLRYAWILNAERDSVAQVAETVVLRAEDLDGAFILKDAIIGPRQTHYATRVRFAHGVGICIRIPDQP